MKDIDRIAKKRERILKGFEREDTTQIESAIEALLQAPNGRKFLWWLLELGGFGRNPFTNNALSTSFNCGELNVSQKILARIVEVNPAGYAQMVTEKEDERERRDTILGAAGDEPGDSSDDGTV